MRLDGKVAVITGGGSGMGKVASELFASEGAKVVLTDVNDEAGEAAAAEIVAGERRRRLRPRRRLEGVRSRGDGATRPSSGSAGSTSSTTTRA